MAHLQSPDLEQLLPVDAEERPCRRGRAHQALPFRSLRLATALAAGLGLAGTLVHRAATTPAGRFARALAAHKLGLVAETGTSTSTSASTSQATSTSDLLPTANLNDGNPCADDEEMLGGLCYERCNTLTQGTHPYRQSAFMCCTNAQCASGLFSMFTCCKHGMGLCSGFAVAGQMEGKDICPHKPGACLTNEEMYLGVCYKKCSLLTNGQQPYRTSASSCCSQDSSTACLLPSNVVTNNAFDTGGGCDDTSNVTECAPHPPRKALTEAQPAAGAPAVASATGGATTVSTVAVPTPPVSAAAAHEVKFKDSEDLIPKERMNDGNPCADDEELHAGLCYGKCNALTQGIFPYRGSAFQCCKSTDCIGNLFKMLSCCKTTMGFCSGFNAAGASMGQGVCPHKIGACLNDEELYMGVCYKKCGLLTAGKYPYRSAAASCCSNQGAATCLLPGYAQTDPAFEIGGGCDDDSNVTECAPHPPRSALTEEKPTTTLPPTLAPPPPPTTPQAPSIAPLPTPPAALVVPPVPAVPAVVPPVLPNYTAPTLPNYTALTLPPLPTLPPPPTPPAPLAVPLPPASVAALPPVAVPPGLPGLPSADTTQTETTSTSAKPKSSSSGKSSGGQKGDDDDDDEEGQSGKKANKQAQAELAQEQAEAEKAAQYFIPGMPGAPSLSSLTVPPIPGLPATPSVPALGAAKTAS